MRKALSTLFVVFLLVIGSGWSQFGNISDPGDPGIGSFKLHDPGDPGIG
ncbi:hypothetical protein [Halobacillus litoralis]|nr:hypothetical protein [Halobacillus litoralis]